MYNVSYDSSTGVCTLEGVARDPARAKGNRPWTGKMIRDAEGAIWVLCGALACGLLARAVRG